MAYQAYGVSLTAGQKQSLRAAVNAKRGVTLRLSAKQLTGPDQLMLTRTQLNHIAKAKRAQKGADIKMSKAQITKQGGFLGALAAGLAAPMIGKMFGFGRGMQLPGTRRRGRGLQLPGTGRGLQLPGTKRGRGPANKKKQGGLLWMLPALLK